ncbi:ABC transporter permease [Pleomorphomonas sp. NRK KF1]|uniref:ABC transporter permease n=1 Tax=Pleomorphomonas sp. NRK KF1 TaxID=2943000 RepID=UPI002043866C|nr:ABC transporter permease [Pleomorphomonas sp. NRK KF1]MCM5552930.1 ABC transporter permease [Pleomorphomonas sp. NRK KF1]
MPLPFLLPAFTLSALVFLAPFVWLAGTSLRVQAEGSLLLSDGVSLSNYRRLFADPFFLEVLLRTLLYSVGTTLISLLIALPVARFLVTRAGRMKGILLALMLVPLVSGALLPSLGMLHLMGPLGVVNGAARLLGLPTVKLLGTPTGILIGLVQSFLPLMVLPLVNTFARLPLDLEQAAASLGAPALAVWRRVILPLAMPGIVAGAVLVFCAAFTSFVTPQILGQGHIATFGTVAYQQAGQVLDWPFASALAVLALVMIGLLQAAVSIGSRLARRREVRP